MSTEPDSYRADRDISFYRRLVEILTPEEYRLFLENFFFKTGVETLSRMIPYMLEALAKDSVLQEQDRRMRVDLMKGMPPSPVPRPVPKPEEYFKSRGA